jgi:dihydrofolate reductase
VTVSLVVALAANRVIGDERGMPWKLPADLRRFRAVTMGKPIVMGRTTHDLIGKPLPGRENIVLTRNRAYQRPGVHVVHTPDEALALARTFGDEVMIVGGGEVYRHFAPLADRLYLTVVEGEFPGTATFPIELLAAPRWAVAEQQHCPADERNSHSHHFYRLEKADDGIDPSSLLAGPPPALE